MESMEYHTQSQNSWCFFFKVGMQESGDIMVSYIFVPIQKCGQATLTSYINTNPKSLAMSETC